MKRHLVVAGGGLCSIGLTSVLVYLISTISAGTHNPPAWPYLICAGLFVVGAVIYVIGSVRSPQRHESAPSASETGGETNAASKSEPLPAETVQGHNKRSNARFFLAFFGIVFTALGLWAFIALRGRPQALLAALIAIGLVLIAISIIHFRRRAKIIALMLGVVGAITLQYTVWTSNYQGSSAAATTCANGSFAHQSIPINWIPYRTDNDSRFMTSNGIHTLYYPELRWAGYYLPLPSRLCDYTVSLFVKEVAPAREPVVGDGWGYGLGVCDMALPSAPAGFSFQYSFFKESANKTVGDFGIVYLPRANTFPNGVNPAHPPYALDGKWHQWTLKVVSDQVTIYFDDDYQVAQEHLTGSGLPDNCSSSGVFFRVWGGTAQFHDFYVTSNS